MTPPRRQTTGTASTSAASAAAAFAMYQRYPFEHLLVGAPPALVGAVEDTLHPYLKERLQERLSLAVTATIEAIREAAMAAEIKLERRREQGLLDELRSRLGRHDRAAAGLPAVLEALADRRVERLLVSSGYREAGWSCASCGTLAKVGPKLPALRRRHAGGAGRGGRRHRRRPRRFLPGRRV